MMFSYIVSNGVTNCSKKHEKIRTKDVFHAAKLTVSNTHTTLRHSTPTFPCRSTVRTWFALVAT